MTNGPMGNDGIKVRLDNLDREVDRLWSHKASIDVVVGNKEDILELRKAIDELRESFGSLMKAILVACVMWALGSAGFIIGVLTLVGNR
jgi:hypothetical protein